MLAVQIAGLDELQPKSNVRMQAQCLMLSNDGDMVVSSTVRSCDVQQ